MRLSKCIAGLVAWLVCATTTYAADEGLITKPSKYSAKETVARFEAAVKQREAAGFIVFTEIDHADAAKKFGLDMRPRAPRRRATPNDGAVCASVGRDERLRNEVRRTFHTKLMFAYGI